MKSKWLFVTIGVMIFILTACSNTSASKISEWVVPDTEFPLAEPGPHCVGVQEYTIVDESRGGREIEIAIWYPAKEQTDALRMRDAPADKRDAPYPLILTDNATGGELIKEHLTTHGFVMVEVLSPDEYANWDFGIIDHPLDLLFALDQVASNPPQGLEGIIDSVHAGITGYSWGGLYSLALSGARIDPEYYLSYCEQAPAMQPALEKWYIQYTCDLSKKWETFTAHVGDEITTSDEGLWQQVTDERIRAVMPMAEYGTWLYGKKGLAAADRPVLIIALTDDEYIPYRIEVPYLFEHLGTPERYLISILGKGHMMVFDPEQAKRLNHFATAFFGTYFQGKSEYRAYFSEDFVMQFDDLAWGVYDGE